jgi:hypothetical protein
VVERPEAVGKRPFQALEARGECSPGMVADNRSVCGIGKGSSTILQTLLRLDRSLSRRTDHTAHQCASHGGAEVYFQPWAFTWLQLPLLPSSVSNQARRRYLRPTPPHPRPRVSQMESPALKFSWCLPNAPSRTLEAARRREESVSPNSSCDSAFARSLGLGTSKWTIYVLKMTQSRRPRDVETAHVKPNCR